MKVNNPFKKELESIVEDSSRVLDVFTKTVDELSAINTRVDEEVTKKQEEKAKLEKDIETLTVTGERNAKIINKIEKLLE